MNREGKSYRSERLDSKDKSKINGSIVMVTRSTKWSPDLDDDKSNFTHHCLVLECPQDPGAVGREVRLDERKYVSSVTKKLTSTWFDDDLYVEI
jgi:hypothetical protein